MPDDALSSAAEILESTFGLLTVTGISLNATQDSSTLSPKENHVNLETIFIDELELSGRAYNALKRANVNTLLDLLQYSAEDLLEFKNFGQKSADEVCESLKKRFNIELRS
jgi:DNA-directed RNA polymerase subunit alpha